MGVSLSLVLACLSAAISLYGAGRYFYGILKGDTRPRTASWIAWLTANTVFTAIAFLDHAYLAAVINGLAAAANAAVLGVSASKRQGIRPQGAIDWSCLIAATVCLAIPLLFPENKLLGALLAMVANATATWPTVLHAWFRPREETWQLFAANAVAGGLSFVGIALETGMSLATLAGPLMTIIGSGSLVFITVGRGIISRAKKEIMEVEELLESSPAQANETE